jgi:hypothetical protein
MPSFLKKYPYTCLCCDLSIQNKHQEFRHKEKMKNKNEAAKIANVPSSAPSAPLQSDAAVLIAKLETAQKFLKNKSDLIDYMEREIHKDPDDPEYREYDFSKLLENARDLRTQIDVAKAKKTEDLKKIIRSCNPTAEQKAFFGKLVSFGVDELNQMESFGLALANASSIYKTALTTPQNTKEETITLFQEFVEKVNNRRSNPYGESQNEDDFDFSAFLSGDADVVTSSSSSSSSSKRKRDEKQDVDHNEKPEKKAPGIFGYISSTLGLN